MNDTVRRLWRHSLWVTVPISIVFALWARGTWSRWNDYHVRQETSDELDLVHCAELEFDHMVREAAVGLRHPRKGAALAATGLETLHLYVPESGLRALDSHLPGSGRDYVEGSMEYGGAVHEVDLRYRGDNVYHWGYWKKSWRVKTKREALFDGMRKFNLVAPRTPEVLNNYLAYRLAAHMGLVAPKARLCNLMVNGRLMGLYVLTEQLDESTLRRHERMPGDLYSGELIGRDVYLGARTELFDHPGAWTKVAVNNHFADEADAPLRALLHHVQRVPDPASQRALDALVDIDAFARFSAFEALSCTVHVDTVHNWRLYYDPWHTRFEPIVWDPVGWYWTMRPRPGVALRPDVITSPLHVALFQNGDFLRARWRVFREFFDGGRDEAFLLEARETVRRLRRSLELDPHLVASAELVSPQRAEAEATKLVNDIAALFDALRAALCDEDQGEVAYSSRGDGALRVSVRGRQPVDELRLTFEKPVPGAVDATVRWRTRAGAHSADLSGSVAVSGRHVTLFPGLLASHRLSITTMEPEESRLNGLFVDAATYDIELSGGADRGALVELEWRTRSDAGWRRTTLAETLEERTAGPLHRAVREQPAAAPTVWSGERIIDEDVTVEGELVIEPGTRLRIAPSVSIYVRGRLRAAGTPSEPITIGPYAANGSEETPWGTFALVGEACNGSVLRHCSFRLGSGSIAPLAEYSAMFSIHAVQNVLVEDCTFMDSLVVDDMVHGVYSDVTFTRCLFQRSKSDALDMDISRVTVEGCHFDRSGNDSIDLMTTEAAVFDTRFTESGDKGISVGENSRLAAQNCRFERCLIAVQSKDESTAVLIQCDVEGCGVGLDAYKKNWRYDGGGAVFAYKSRIDANEVSLRVDKHSVIAVRDSFIGPEEASAVPRRIALDAVDSVESSTARLPGLDRFPDEERAFGARHAPLWERSDPGRRGSTLRP